MTIRTVGNSEIRQRSAKLLKMFEGKTSNGKLIVDEFCSCGHYRSHHNDNLGGLAVGHGNCTECGCKQFTWIESVS
mgnify:CR=1 FL=1